MIKIMFDATETPLADVRFPEVMELHDAFRTFSRTHLGPLPTGVLCLEKTANWKTANSRCALSAGTAQTKRVIILRGEAAVHQSPPPLGAMTSI